MPGRASQPRDMGRGAAGLGLFISTKVRQRTHGFAAPRNIPELIAYLRNHFRSPALIEQSF